MLQASQCVVAFMIYTFKEIIIDNLLPMVTRCFILLL